MMLRIQNRWMGLLGCIGAIWFTSCAIAPSDPPPIERNPASTPPTEDNPTIPPTTPPAALPQTTVTLYTVDDQCQDWVSESVSVPETTAIESTVDQLLRQSSGNGLELSGYRVQPTNDTVVIDIRVKSDSPRSLYSLSACEQKALLGSIQETLTRHPDWNIETVTFTESGDAIVF
jgi:hypothetical protein